MIKFIVKHPISVFLAVIFHIILVAAFSLQWSDKAEIIKVSSSGDENIEIKQVATLEPMKTVTVDATQVQAQLKKNQAQQEAGQENIQEPEAQRVQIN